MTGLLLGIILVCVMVGAVALGAYSLSRARENGETEKFALAVEELEREVGAVLLPPLERLAEQLTVWMERARR